MSRSVTNQRLAWGLGELAAATGLSLGFLSKEVHCGSLRAKRVGRRILIMREDWNSYLSRRDEQARNCDESRSQQGDEAQSRVQSCRKVHV